MPKKWVSGDSDVFDAYGSVESVQSCEGDVRVCLVLSYALRLEMKDSIVRPCFKGQCGMWEGGRGSGNRCRHPRTTLNLAWGVDFVPRDFIDGL